MINMRYFTLILLILIFAIPVTHAADTVLEVGIPGITGAAPGDPAPGMVKYISFLYTFVLGFVGIAGFASLVFWGAVWAGSGIIDKKRQALDGIKNSLTGIAIALTAFIILNTINPDLTIIKEPIIRGISIEALKAQKMSTEETRVRQILNDVGININKGSCPPAYTNCSGIGTNVGGLPGEAINGLLELKKACNCDIMVTGGTENGHQSHGTGKPMVDLRSDKVTNNYIQLLINGTGNVRGPGSKIDIAQIKIGNATYPAPTYVVKYKGIGCLRIIDERGEGANGHWHLEFNSATAQSYCG